MVSGKKIVRVLKCSACSKLKLRIESSRLSVPNHYNIQDHEKQVDILTSKNQALYDLFYYVRIIINGKSRE